MSEIGCPPASNPSADTDHEAMQTKSSSPVGHIAGRTALPIIEAYFEINHLKGLLRQGWLRCGVEPAQCESVAEHSFGVAMLVRPSGAAED